MPEQAEGASRPGYRGLRITSSGPSRPRHWDATGRSSTRWKSRPLRHERAVPDATTRRSSAGCSGYCAGPASMLVGILLLVMDGVGPGRGSLAAAAAPCRRRPPAPSRSGVDRLRRLSAAPAPRTATAAIASVPAALPRMGNRPWSTPPSGDGGDDAAFGQINARSHGTSASRSVHSGLRPGSVRAVRSRVPSASPGCRAPAELAVFCVFGEEPPTRGSDGPRGHGRPHLRRSAARRCSAHRRPHRPAAALPARRREGLSPEWDYPPAASRRAGWKAAP